MIFLFFLFAIRIGADGHVFDELVKLLVEVCPEVSEELRASLLEAGLELANHAGELVVLEAGGMFEAVIDEAVTPRQRESVVEVVVAFGVEEICHRNALVDALVVAIANHSVEASGDLRSNAFSLDKGVFFCLFFLLCHND